MIKPFDEGGKFMDRRMTFNEVPAFYDRYRPRYVPELFDDLLRYAGLGLQSKALEIGLGTGQATGPLLATGAQVTALEPGSDLAAFARERFAAQDNLAVVETDFEGFDPGEGVYDLIYSATAFHWIRPEAGFPKLRALLKPGAAVALFWNHPYVNRQDEPAHRAMRQVYARYSPRPEGELKEFGEADCARYQQLLAQYGFEDISVTLYRQTRLLSADDYIGLMNTYSDHLSKPQPIRLAMEKDMRAAIEGAGGMLPVYDTMDLYMARAPR